MLIYSSGCFSIPEYFQDLFDLTPSPLTLTYFFMLILSWVRLRKDQKCPTAVNGREKHVKIRGVRGDVVKSTRSDFYY